MQAVRPSQASVYVMVQLTLSSHAAAVDMSYSRQEHCKLSRVLRAHLLVEAEAVSQHALVGRAAARGRGRQQAGLEPAAVLVAALRGSSKRTHAAEPHQARLCKFLKQPLHGPRHGSVATAAAS